MTCGDRAERARRSRGRGRALAGSVGMALAVAALFPAAALAPADLSITKSDSPDPVNEGVQLRYTMEVQNNGPDPVTAVEVVDDLPMGDVDFVSATPSQGSCDEQGGKVTCQLGAVASGGTAPVTILVTAKKAGTVTNTASV